MRIGSTAGEELARIGRLAAPARPAVICDTHASPPRADLTQDVHCCLSPLAAAIATAGLDTSCSCVRQSQAGAQLEFSLAFASQRLGQLKARGVYVAESEEMHLSLSFTFERQTVVEGRSERCIYQVQLNLSATNVRATSLDAFEEKEDISQLVRRLVDDLIEVACKENTRLAGVIIDHEDLLELASRDRGRILDALAALIQVVIHYTHMFKALSEGKAVQDVILTPQRQKTSGVRVHQEAISLTDFSLSLRQVDRTETQSQTPARPLPAEETEEKTGVSPSQ